MDYELIPLLGLIYGIYLQYKLFNSIGKTIPFIELALALSGIQLLISPYLDYTYFQNDIFGIMRVSSEQYFSFMLPAIIAIHLGTNLSFSSKINKYELLLFHRIKNEKKRFSKLGLNLIIVGYIAHILVSLPIPSSFQFILTTAAFLRFIGFIYIWIAESKYTHIAFIIVFLPFLFEVVNQTIFIDLILWSFFLLSIYALYNKINKIFLVVLGIIAFSSLFILQTVKYSYRKIVWEDTDNRSSLSNIYLLGELMSNTISTIDENTLKMAGASMNVRVNQGWIITDVMSHYERRPIIRKGHWLSKELLGILLPRFLYPSKPVVGDHDKFEEFAGWRMSNTTSINVGIPGDGYGNFGLKGGIFFCFGFGLFLGFSIRTLYKLSNKYPDLIIWGFLIFFYAIRAGNEFYIIANWIVKTGVFTFFFFYLFKPRYRQVSRFGRAQNLV